MTENTSDTLPRVGIAMIARNAEELMPLALEPLKEHVDEIAVVLGGRSADGTAEVARKYATLPIEDFSGPLDEKGRLTSFAQARNQSFDILKRAGLDYALVVDTDDNWRGGENLKVILSQMVGGGFPMAMFPYRFDGGSFVQPRLYKMSSGHWEGPCHNFWEMDGGERIAIQSDMLSIEQRRPDVIAHDRRWQNIEISERWMVEHGPDCRLLQHMAKDLLVDREFDKARDALEKYFDQYDLEQRQDPEEFYMAWQTLASIHICQGRYAEALHASFQALAVRSHASSWAMASEAAGFMAKGARADDPLLRLSEFCADQALSVGRPRHNLHWHSEKLSASVPLLLKARALGGQGRWREALGTLDLGLAIDPESEEMKSLRRDVCRYLGEME